jgi:hypothetical protein
VMAFTTCKTHSSSNSNNNLRTPRNPHTPRALAAPGLGHARAHKAVLPTHTTPRTPFQTQANARTRTCAHATCTVHTRPCRTHGATAGAQYTHAHAERMQRRGHCRDTCPCRTHAAPGPLQGHSTHTPMQNACSAGATAGAQRGVPHLGQLGLVPRCLNGRKVQAGVKVLQGRGCVWPAHRQTHTMAQSLHVVETGHGHGAGSPTRQPREARRAVVTWDTKGKFWDSTSSCCACVADAIWHSQQPATPID